MEKIGRAVKKRRWENRKVACVSIMSIFTTAVAVTAAVVVTVIV